MDENASLSERFEKDRTRLRAVAYRMLGSVTEADDAVQETWLRLSRTADAHAQREDGEERADGDAAVRHREPHRLADHGRVARVPQHVARPREPP